MAFLSSSLSGQQKVVSVLPHITGSLSWLGSLSIIIDIVRKYCRRGNSNSRPSTYHRVMLGMSLFDLLMGTNQMLNTLVAPADLPDVYLNYGTEASCKAFGFIAQLGIGSPFYNLFLSIYYYLFIVKNQKPSIFVESCMHLGCISFAFGTAITALAMDWLGFAGFWCWITSEHKTAQLLVWHVPIWCIMAIVSVIMSAIYFTLRKQEDRQRKFQFSNTASPRVSDSVKWQAFLYVGSFVMAWSSLTVTRLMSFADVTAPFWLTLAGVTLSTSQGFFNFWIYIRPRYKEHRKKHPEVGRLATFFRVHPFFTGCECCRSMTSMLKRLRVAAVVEDSDAEESPQIQGELELGTV